MTSSVAQMEHAFNGTLPRELGRTTKGLSARTARTVSAKASPTTVTAAQVSGH